MGEGGVIATDSDEVAEKARQLRNLAFLPERRFVHEELGWNYRLGSLQAALGLSQMKRLDEVIAARRAIAKRYLERLSDVESFKFAPTSTEIAENDFWVFGILLQNNLVNKRGEIMTRLAEANIGTRPFFHPLHLQPIVQKMCGQQANLPVAENLGKNGFYLPSYPTLTQKQQDFICVNLLNIVAEIGK